MNPTHRTLDACGLPCPQPVILARKALAEGGFDTLEITVDDAAARENLLKFAAYAQCRVAAVTAEGALTRILLAPREAVPVDAPPAPAAPTLVAPIPALAPGEAHAAVLLITAEGIGQGDPELGRLLMRGFLYTLTEAETTPRRLILMNGGVKLAVAGSEALASLDKLAARGVQVLSCGTCLEFYGLLGALAVGGVTNMYEIAGHLLEGSSVSIG